MIITQDQKRRRKKKRRQNIFRNLGKSRLCLSRLDERSSVFWAEDIPAQPQQRFQGDTFKHGLDDVPHTNGLAAMYQFFFSCYAVPSFGQMREFTTTPLAVHCIRKVSSSLGFPPMFQKAPPASLLFSFLSHQSVQHFAVVANAGTEQKTDETWEGAMR